MSTNPVNIIISETTYRRLKKQKETMSFDESNVTFKNGKVIFPIPQYLYDKLIPLTSSTTSLEDVLNKLINNKGNQKCK